MKIRDYRTIFIDTLAPFYGQHESESFFYMVLENRCQLRRIDLALQPEATFPVNDLSAWEDVVRALLHEIPIQYILGTADFCGLEFKVSPSVLIPRPETEELVEWIYASRKSDKISILDIGTGSGCIAISLAHKLPESTVHAIDISPEALLVAKENAASNKVNITFKEIDILAATSLSQKYDVIVSNPPYVRELEKNEIKQNVIANEPHIALFVDDDDALIFYKKISDLAVNSLNENGLLFFEINQYLPDETVDMLASKGFSTELHKDIYNKYRMICARKATHNATLQ